MEPTNEHNLVDKVIRYEEGEMDFDEAVEFFQYLIDTGMAWTLQGSYGRMARDMIEAEYCHA